MGFFVLDREGIVRYTRSGAYVDGHASRPIPTMPEITRELQQCARPSSGTAAG
jgi:hypothetical protein